MRGNIHIAFESLSTFGKRAEQHRQTQAGPSVFQHRSEPMFAVSQGLGVGRQWDLSVHGGGHFARPGRSFETFGAGRIAGDGLAP